MLCHDLGRTWSRLTEERSLPVYKDIELPVAGVLSRMEVHGIAVAKDVLQSQFDELSAEVDEIAKQAYEIIGHEVNLASQTAPNGPF